MLAKRMTELARLVKRLIPRIEILKIGPSTDPMADYGPLVTKAHLDKVKAYVDLGMQRRRKDSCRRSRFQDARLLERLLHGRVPV
jgi:acyl-CoA reductase-like NAD-dependent aldehyde dehydrogenase